LNFYNISIGKRLALGFSLITIITIFLGIFVIAEFKNGLSTTQNMLNHSYRVNNSIKTIETDIISIRNAVLSMLINKDEIFIGKQIKKIDLYDKNIQEHFEILHEKYIGPKSDLNKAYNIYTSTIQIRTNLFNKIKEGNLEEAKVFMQTKGHKLMQSLQEEIRLLDTYASDKANDLFNLAQKNEKTTTNILIVSLVLLVLISSIISITIIKSIVSPLNILIDMSQKINKGDFSVLKTRDAINLKK